jgi:hypothetical protein
MAVIQFRDNGLETGEVPVHGGDEFLQGVELGAGLVQILPDRVRTGGQDGQEKRQDGQGPAPVSSSHTHTVLDKDMKILCKFAGTNAYIRRLEN